MLLTRSDKTFPDYFETLFSIAQCPEVPVISIDGPTASGKGTLAARVAQRLGYHYLDSGALYRVTAHAALAQGLLLRPIGRTLYWMPPYVLDEEAAQHLLTGVTRVMDQLLPHASHAATAAGGLEPGLA